MDKRFACYCGLYCENCPMKVSVYPAAKNLYDEMKKAGFDNSIQEIPGGEGFWTFLKDIAENWECTSCIEGSGDPGCKIRLCAKEKSVEMCVLCESYPCNLMEEIEARQPSLAQDNALLRDKGWEAWGKLQDDRQAAGYTYADEKRAE